MVCVIRSERESIFLSCEKCWSFKEFFVPNPCALETYQNDCVCLFIFPEKWERGGWGTEQSWENRDFGRQVILLNSLWMLCSLGGKGSFNLPSLFTPTLSSNRTWAHVGRQWFVSPSSTQIQIGDFDFSSSLTNLNFGFEEKKKKKACWFISSLEGISCWILSNWSALLFCVQLSP